VHQGRLLLERLPDGSLRARHADGSEYGSAVEPHALDLRAKVFSALRNMGFREGEVRTAMEQARSDGDFAQVLKEALARLRPARR
jgi:Holliday junction resolvasome RuvABC DNA-binding subunit